MSSKLKKQVWEIDIVERSVDSILAPVNEKSSKNYIMERANLHVPGNIVYLLV